MNVLLLGSGGREHAFAYKISQSKLLNKLYIVPGNAGTALCGENIEGNPANAEFVKKIILEKEIDCIVAGPEEPLVKGIRNALKKELHGLEKKIFVGPSAAAAQLEGSKAFAKRFMQKHGIPTARFMEVCKENLAQGMAFLSELPPPYVLKADGLAAGKGVLIIPHLNDAREELKNILINKSMGVAGDKVIVEEFLQGTECSCFVFTDGRNYQLLPFAKDYKRVGDGDTGPNTGGMGAVCPVSFVDEPFLQKVKERIIHPTLDGMKKEGNPYEGFLFIGLMNVKGNPYVIEYNCRMGDPETQAVFPLLRMDFLEWFQRYHEKKLHSFPLQIEPGWAVTIVLASQGYPGNYEKNKIINIQKNFSNLPNAFLFFAGVKSQEQHLITSGGRVLSVTAVENSLPEAIRRAYHLTRHISFENQYYRNDIGKDLLPSGLEFK